MGNDWFGVDYGQTTRMASDGRNCSVFLTLELAVEFTAASPGFAKVGPFSVNGPKTALSSRRRHCT